MATMAQATEFRLLGPLEVRVDGSAMPLGGAKQRTLLALLLVNAGDVVPVERIVDELWVPEPPASAAQSVQMHVSRLRKQLAASGNGDLLVTRPSGYAVAVDPERLDSDRFRRLLEHARRHRDAGGPEPARALYGEALTLWRGEALAGVPRGPMLNAEVAQLEDLRLHAQLERIDCDLELGRHADVTGELELLARRHPLHERIRAQLMLALYRCGRQAESLDVHRRTRALLVEELGIEPGDALQDLQRRVLRQDPALAAPARPSAESPAPVPRAASHARAGWRTFALVAAAVVIAAVAGLAVIGGSDRPDGLERIDADAVGVIEPGTGRIAAQIEGGGRPVGLAATPGALWIAREDPGALMRVDPDELRAVDTVPLRGNASAVAAGAGAVWAVSAQAGEVAQIDLRTNRIVRRIRTGNGARAVTVGAGGVWVVNGLDNNVWRVDPESGRTVARIPVGATPSGVASAGGDVWVANEGDGTITRIDTATNAPVANIAVGNGPSAVAATRGAVWVANALDGTLSRVDAATNSVAATVRVGGSPRALAATGDTLWAGDAGSGSLARVDVRTGHVGATVPVGGAPTTLLASAGRLWAAAQASPASHRGGTLVMTGADVSPRHGSLDPAIAFSNRSSPLLAAVADGLLAMRRAGGAAGAVVVPDLARSVPRPGDGGLTYRFQLRAGLRYSTGEPVRARDVRASVERLHRMSSFVAASFPLGLRGDERCTRRRCDLSAGITVDDATGTVTFHLRRPNPDFALNLAQPTYAVLPAGTPARDVTGAGLVGTGPYRVAAATPGREVVLERNPRFREWSPAAQPAGLPDRIVWRVVEPASGIGGADLGMDPTPAEVQHLRVRDPELLHRWPYPDIVYVWLNTRVAPFDRLEARQAVARATDRRALLRKFAEPDGLVPTCQVIPPGAAGYLPYCPFAAAPATRSAAAAVPDVDRARRLVERSHTAGAKVTFLAPGDHPDLVAAGRAIVRTLRRIGYRATLDTRHFFRKGPRAQQYHQWTRDAGNRAQIGFGTWQGIFPLATAVIPPLLSCEALRHPDPATTYQQAQFCDPAISADMDRARALQTSDPAAATALWTRIDHELVRRAPLIPLWTAYGTAASSRRLGNLQYAAGLGPLVDQAWVR